MKVREVLVGFLAAIASALASIAVFNRALNGDKTLVTAGVAFSEGGTPQEERHSSPFLPKREQERAENVAPVEVHQREPVQIPPGWSEPKPKEIPSPTFWPVVMAVGITFIFWGIVTSLIISGVGIILFAVSLAGWIGDMRHENAHD